MIDLDLVEPNAPEVARRTRRFVARPVAVLGVVLAALLTLGAAAGPSPTVAPVMAVGGTPAAAFVLGPPTLYVASFGPLPNSQAGIRAYALPDGSARWAADVQQNVQSLTVRTGVGVLVARSGNGPEATFLDTGSGQQLWRSTAIGTRVTAVAERTVLLSTEGRDGIVLRLADLRTGATVWSRTVPPAGYLDTDSPSTPTRVITVSDEGRATVLRLADGRVLATTDLRVRPLSFDRDEAGDFAEVAAVGDRIYVASRQAGGTAMAAYRTDSLTSLWRTTGGPVGPVSACGTSVCTTDLHALTARDAADGSVRWSDSRWRAGRALADGRVFVVDHRDDPEAALVDPVSGRMLARLGLSVAVGELALRSDSRQRGRTVVTVARAGTSGLHTVGSIGNAIPYGCSALRPYLVCPTTYGPTTVWRVPG